MMQSFCFNSTIFLLIFSLYAHGLVSHKTFQIKTDLSAVKSIVSTPNPLSFKLELDHVILSGCGQTFQFANEEGCPEVVCNILGFNGVESVYTMPDWVCINKLPGESHSWNDLLPLCVAALGGPSIGSEALDALDRLNMNNEKRLSTESALVISDNQISATIRLQASNGIPIQIEASDGLTTKRQALSQRFSTIMEEFISQKSTGKMQFFEGRTWVKQGTLYADTIDDALVAAVDDVEAMYSEERLQSLIGRAALKTQDPSFSTTQDMTVSGRLFSLQSLRNSSALSTVEHLCNLASDKFNEDKDNSALLVLTGFVRDGLGSIPARRMAIAYVGSCTGEFYSTNKDEIFKCLSIAFVQEKAAGMRRTAGDSLSDFGDERAVPLAAKQLLIDDSKLVRWRAARILGELGGPSLEDSEGDKLVRNTLNTAITALQEAILVDLQSFEVVFECTNSLALLQNGEGEKSIPVWQKMAGGI